MEVIFTVRQVQTSTVLENDVLQARKICPAFGYGPPRLGKASDLWYLSYFEETHNKSLVPFWFVNDLHALSDHPKAS